MESSSLLEGAGCSSFRFGLISVLSFSLSFGEIGQTFAFAQGRGRVGQFLIFEIGVDSVTADWIDSVFLPLDQFHND